MLSRVADSLYWIGRYLERAENVGRLMLVAGELSVSFEGLDESLAQAEWDGVIAGVAGEDRPGFGFSRETGLAVPYVKWLLLDDSNPVSVRHSLARARENARSIREALTKEVFSNLNELHRELARPRRISGPIAGQEVVASTHQAILTTLGAIEHTMSRDQGWVFMKLGEAMERTRRTLLVLRAKLPTLALDAGDAGLPLYYARWRGLLRSLASLENYRMTHGARLEPETVIRFLLFDRVAPRSVYVGVTRLVRYLDQLPGGERTSEADRTLGRLHAALTWNDDEIVRKGDLVEFCAEAAAQLGVAHGAIAREYFPS